MSDYWFLFIIFGSSIAGFIYGLFAGHRLATRWYWEDRAEARGQQDE